MTSHPIFVEHPEFDWPVTLQWPDNGQWQPLVLHTRLRLLDADSVQQLLDSGDSQSLLDRLVVSIQESAQKPLNKAQQQRLLGYFPVQKAIINAYQAAITGQEAKN